MAEVRTRILNAGIAQAAATGGLLFEPDPSGLTIAKLTCAMPNAGSGEWSAGFSTTSLFTRWARVNASILPLPESTGLWDSLPASCCERLTHVSVRACIPLVHERRLVGLVFVLGGEPWIRTDRRLRLIEADLPGWAAALSAAQLEQQAAAKAALVSRSNRLSLVGQAAATAAHEARNPLAIVRSMVQLVLTREAPVAEHDRLLTTVLAQVDRVNAALSRTLSLSRNHETTQTAVDVPSLVTEAAIFCRAYAHRRGQTITIQRASPASVKGDQHELHQVLVNVLMNACQASAQGASIEVDTEVSALGQVSIAVNDHGSGMTADLLARACEPFFSTRQDGGGLGLAISREIVLRHGGDLMIDSTVGAGTTVTLRLPTGDPDAPYSRG